MTQLLLDADCLLEILPNEWPTLQNLYASKKTDSIGYNLIKNYVEWIDKKLNLDVKCFTIDEDWRKDGTFIMIAKHGGILDYVYFNTLCDDLDRLIRLLYAFTTQTKASLNLYGYGQRLKPAVDDCIKKLAPKKYHESLKTAWYRASKELVATFSTETPPGITLRKLEIEDAETVNELWPHHDKGTIKFVKHAIQNDLTIAACDSNGKLLAWCLRLPLGSLGLLQVMPSQKRLGLGSLMVRVLSKKIAEQDLDVFAPVVSENTPSRRMFEKRLPLGSLGMLHVVASQRRLGLGSLMVRCLSKKIAEHNDEVLASVVPENMPSREMFEKLGFRQIDNVYWTSGSATK